MAHPIIPWPGGKRRLLKYLLSDIPDHKAYVEVFAGGAALLLAKEPAPAEVVNDNDGELIRLYRCVQHHLDELVRQFRWALVSREMFRWTQLQHPDTLTDIQRAARFYYMQKLCFGGKAKGRTFGVAAAAPPRLNLLRMEEDLSQAHMRLARVTIEHLEWRACVDRYDRAGSLFFFDPPYWETLGYSRDFGPEQYALLADTLATMKGKAILTINDHPEMARTFRQFRTQKVRIKYTVGGNGRGGETGELIVRNW
ncbi:MAG: DNA adenine methylase [Dokdonella sp.]